MLGELSLGFSLMGRYFLLTFPLIEPSKSPDGDVGRDSETFLPFDGMSNGNRRRSLHRERTQRLLRSSQARHSARTRADIGGHWELTSR